MSFKDGGQSGKREKETRKKAGAGAKWKKKTKTTQEGVQEILLLLPP